MKHIYTILHFLIIAIASHAQFAPPAGQEGSTAIAHNSAQFIAWATGCEVTRGYQDISNTSLGYASVGENNSALGIAGQNGVVSLGDGGVAILTFDIPISNGDGWDFAVFENSFSDAFLELAFVEVSSDGINFFRFPATSNTPDSPQIEGFGETDATKINNLAGKYRALFGTPFDLEELANEDGLDINAVTHVKIIDVVGCVQDVYATYDQHGNKINDPWSTPFASSGFDLDAVGVINSNIISVKEDVVSSISIYPNPINQNSQLQFRLQQPEQVRIEIADATGKSIATLLDKHTSSGLQTVSLNQLHLVDGLYLVSIRTNDSCTTQKIIVRND